MSTQKPGPVLIEIKGETPSPADAPLLPEARGQSMQRLAAMAASRPSRLWRLFWAALVSLLVFVILLSAWDFVFALLERNIWMGRAALVVVGVFVLSAALLILREWLAFVRLRRMDGLRRQAEVARNSGDLMTARLAVARLRRFFAKRSAMTWAQDNFAAKSGDILDADALLDLAETELLVPLDAAAMREIEAASRMVATVTAIVPLALVDVITALAANLRMVRKIAEIYGGRAGLFGSWRLLRTVLLHLAATGAVAIGDDLIGSLAGGGLVSKLSRRFGEGVVNGALTARVGVAAMEVCRPMPFVAIKKPGVSGLVKQALTGVFGSRK